ncbi:MAG: hypothetical protein U5K00_15035 [Melioribacteraceae bacterium]|nr:hypothetical protein [Melioribacteraceae bacterium]
MLIRSLFGKNEFDARLQKKEKTAADTTPIWKFDRNGDKDREAILYSKGPVL